MTKSKKTFNCLTCGKVYAWPGSLKLHTDTHHPSLAAPVDVDAKTPWAAFEVARKLLAPLPKEQAKAVAEALLGLK